LGFRRAARANHRTPVCAMVVVLDVGAHPEGAMSFGVRRRVPVQAL
jgi:hypothetical protein